jgi:hypothetical protein
VRPGGHNGHVDIDSVADELYSLPLNDFTTTRNERARQARAEGDRALAEQIKRLEKPTTSAWLVNQLARQLGDRVEPLIELGRELREATANVGGDEMRTLTRRRHELVRMLVGQARQLGADRGTKVTDSVAGEVQQTLDASLADPEVAEAVLSGRLTHAAEYAGFGQPVGGDWAGQARRPPRRQTRGTRPGSDANVADLGARRRDSAQRALAEAEDSLASARSDHEAALEAGAQAGNDRRTAEESVRRLRAELETAQGQAHTAGLAERRAHDRAQRAERDLHNAQRARDRAADRLAETEE